MSWLLPRVEDPQRDDVVRRRLLVEIPTVISHSVRDVGVELGGQRRPGSPSPGGDPPIAARHFLFGVRSPRLGCRAAVGAIEQFGCGLGDLVLGRVRAVCAKPGQGMVPGQLAERRRHAVQMLPEQGDPSTVTVVADPDPGDVIRVAVDLPQVLLAGHPGWLTA
jgi:hypothetical protein